MVFSCLHKCHIATMDGTGGCNRVSDDLTFVWVELHLPVFFPLLQFVKVILQDLAVMYQLYLSVQEGIICEESGDGVNLLWHVIYV